MNTKPIYENEITLHLNTNVNPGALVDQIDRRVCQLRAIASLMSESDMGLLPDTTLNGVAWAIRDGLAEIQACAETLGDHAYHPPVTQLAGVKT